MTETRPSGIADTDTYITRMFAAPRDIVFDFWLQPARLAEWWGPVGYSAPAEHIVMERSVGGRFQICMIEESTGTQIWTYGEVLEFVEPELIALQLSVTRPVDDEPITMQLRVQFHDHGERTRITLHQGPFAATEMERGNNIGWSMSFDKLDAAIAGAAGIRP